jgi:hypothetical protein
MHAVMTPVLESGIFVGADVAFAIPAAARLPATKHPTATAHGCVVTVLASFGYFHGIALRCGAE